MQMRYEDIPVDAESYAYHELQTSEVRESIWIRGHTVVYPCGFKCPRCTTVHHDVRDGDFRTCNGCGLKYALHGNGLAVWEDDPVGAPARRRMQRARREREEHNRRAPSPPPQAETVLYTDHAVTGEQPSRWIPGRMHTVEIGTRCPRCETLCLALEPGGHVTCQCGLSMRLWGNALKIWMEDAAEQARPEPVRSPDTGMRRIMAWIVWRVCRGWLDPEPGPKHGPR